MTIAWDSAEKNALLMTHSGRWTWQEFDRANEEGNRLIVSVEHRVNLIVYMADIEAMVPPPGARSRWRDASEHSPSNFGAAILVPGNHFIRAYTAVMSRLAGKSRRGAVYAARTLEEARALSARLLDEAEGSGQTRPG